MRVYSKGDKLLLKVKERTFMEEVELEAKIWWQMQLICLLNYWWEGEEEEGLGEGEQEEGTSLIEEDW